MSSDPKRAEVFVDRLVRILNDGALCLMISIGHRTGLFDSLTGAPPSTSQEIAERAGLNERYVREWLGAMATGGVVEYEPGEKRFFLPEEHSAFLSRSSQRDNLAVFAQYIPVLGSVEEEVLECFRSGGGVPYAKYPRFHAVMAEDSQQTVLSSLMEHILPLMPGLTERLEEGIHVLDVGCGQGRALNLMARTFPKSTFIGYDLSEEAIAEGRRQAEAAGLTNLQFLARDLSRFDRETEPEAFDFITTFDAVHDQAQPLAVLKGIASALKPEGIYLMQDIHASSDLGKNLDHPIGPLLYTVSCLHCMTVSLAQQGEGLGAMWGREKAEELLKEAGFGRIEVHQLEHDIQNDYYVIQK